MTSTARWLLNFSLFQAGWFACVLAAAWQQPWFGTGFVLLALALHLALAMQPRQELALVAAVAVAGGAWDTLVMHLGPIHYVSGQPFEAVTAHWIVALWALFAATLNASMRWVRRSLAVAAVVGGVGGPVAYLAGVELGAADMPQLARGLALQAVGWAVLVPVACLLADRLLSAATASQAESPALAGGDVRP
jgi:hypothetical protein